jgi:hypothetical protein
MGRQVYGKHLGNDCQVKQIHGIGDEAYVGEKPDQYFGAFPDAFEFGEQEETTEAFDKDPEDLCNEDIGRPDYIDDDIRSYHTHDEADVPYPVPEEWVPTVNEGGQDTQGDAIETEYHYFLDSRSEKKIIDIKS